MQDEQIRILCQHAVKYAPNGISAEAVAYTLGMRYATLMSQLSAQPGHKLGAEIVLPIMQVTGSAAPMHHLARQLGGVYVELPPVSPGGHEVTASLVESVRQFGEFAAQVAQSLDDGIITAEEQARIARDGQMALSAILKVMELSDRAIWPPNKKAPRLLQQPRGQTPEGANGMSKNYSQPGTAVNQATYIVTLDGKRVRIMANFRQIMALLPLICAGRQLKEAVA